ncbi:MAG: hypothetical protein MI810_20000 [Flavobacteriales bacterium]|nr:hypothetical protein [Flavobacteriales bacterium]
MKSIKFVAFSFLLFIGSTSMATSKADWAGSSLRHGGEWEKLGSRVVNMKADHDEIPVTITEGVFTKVKLKIMKAPIHLLNMNIIFKNGTNKNVAFNKKFPAGSSTRIIDLPGNKRIIKKVNLNYKSVPAGKGRAVVSLWGKH